MTRHLHFRFRVLCSVVLPLAAIFCLAPIRLLSAQRRTARPAAQPTGPAAPASPAAEQPKFKGIFEPVNYPDDLRLNSVFFASENEGWVGANAGTILHTADGGKTWQAQLGGDLKSEEAPVTGLYFLDQRQGWAIQGGTRLLHTGDGQRWSQTGALPAGDGLYTFLSGSTGVFINWQGIQQTRDGGQTWKFVATCSAKLQIAGLTQTVGCQPNSVFFASQRVGYVFGMSGGDLGALFILKTEDGGTTWSTSVVPNVARWGSVEGTFFLDESTGFVRFNNGKLFMTTDGGHGWEGIAGTTVPGGIAFADPKVGWSLNGGGQFSYTLDSGRNWSARTLRFPAGISSWSMPRRDSAYVVGDHGMIYRYRIVPIDYQVANMVEAPMMPGLTTSLDGTVATMREKAKALQAKLEAAQAKPTGSARPGQSELGSYSGAADGGEQEAPPPASTSGQTEGGFTQDVGNAPLSPPIQACCAAEVQGLQTGVGSFLQEVPAFSSSWRPLNLIIAGLRLASDLLNKAQGVRSAFIALKTAKSLPEASAALQNMMTNLDGAAQTITSRFQNTASLTWPEAAASAATGAASVIAPAGGQPAAAPGSTQPAGTAQNAKPDDTKKTNPTADEIKNKLKKKFGIKFP